MKLEEIQLEHLLPLFMRNDPAAVALAEVASEALQVLARELHKLSTFDALDLLNTAELDALADELRVLWYDKTFTDEQKRVLLLQSDQVYMRLGTVQAVQDVVTAVFGEATVEEFFTYGGKPHYFRIMVKSANELSAENEAKLLRMLEYVKRKSQWLEKIYSTTLGEIALNAGFQLSYMLAKTPRLEHNIQKHRTANGTQNLTARCFEISKPVSGVVACIEIPCRSTSDAWDKMYKATAVYLAVYEENTSGEWVRIGISSNARLQIAGETGTWNFSSLVLSGRPIRFVVYTSINNTNLLSGLYMGARVTASTDGAAYEESPFTTAQQYLIDVTFHVI